MKGQLRYFASLAVPVSKCKDMVICPKHHALLGVKYCPSRKCHHPLHGRGKSRVPRGVDLKMSKEIKETCDVLVSVSSGKCNY